MTDTTSVVLPSAAMAPDRVGQATAVEQSRAVAEVQAAVIVARQFPRVEAVAIARMEQACKHPALADKAFFSFKRGGSTVSGETIHLAKELARCWGNIQHGVAEMSRDDNYGQSEMQAWAWDMESNERVSTTFIVPHARWASGKAQKLADFRDIYENNANNGARRLREMILSVLPVWFVEQAKDLCSATIRHGGGVPLPQRIAEVIAKYDAGGVVTDQLEQHVDRPVAKWTDRDVASLQTLYNSIDRGEMTRDEAFPPRRVTAEEVAASVPKKKAAAPEPPAHTDHDPDALDSECPACRAESAAADRQASS
ncbi:MAG TPA: hypothetical protein VFU74_22145 [Actinocrinis sp.]|nr:hypothetical protein [Actinocrinis sp.]